MIIDPIADLLTRIRNGYLSRLSTIEAPHSKLKAEILRILKKNNHIVEFSLSEDGRTFTITLQDVRKTKYIPSFRRISRPGQRIYVRSTDIKKSRNGVGIFILSTPKGIVTGYEAHALGGRRKILCEVF